MAATDVIEALARTLVNVNLYGAGHRITRISSEQSCLNLQEHLKERGELEFAVAEDILLINNEPVDRPRPTLKLLTERLIAHRVSGIRIRRDCRSQDFDVLVQILGTPPESGEDAEFLSSKLESRGVHAILVTRALYRRVGEDETAPSRASTNAELDAEVNAFLARFHGATHDAAGASLDAKPRSNLQASTPLPTKPSVEPPLDTKTSPDDRPKPEPEPEPSASALTPEDMRDFQEGRPNERADTALHAAARGREKDVNILVSTLIAAIMMRRKGNANDLESLADTVADSLQNAYSAMQSSGVPLSTYMRSVSSVDGKIGKWLEDSDLPGTEAAVARASEVADNAVLPAELNHNLDGFLSRREQAERWESRLRQSIERCGPDRIEAMGLSGTLREAGVAVPSDGRERLDGMPGAADADAMVVDDPPPDTALRAMLAAMQFGDGDGDGNGTTQIPPGFGEELNRIRDEVDALVDSTTRKIEGLLEKVEALRSPKPEQKPPDPAELIDMLAETVQELRQPLSVVQCAIDMLTGPACAHLNQEQQADTLQLAAENSRRLDSLIAKLGAVSGLPSNLAPQHNDLIDSFSDGG